MLHTCNDHLDPEKESDMHQAFAVLGVALISMGEDVGAEMSLRAFNHLVSGVMVITYICLYLYLFCCLLDALW
jgi:hypothetical protein